MPRLTTPPVIAKVKDGDLPPEAWKELRQAIRMNEGRTIVIPIKQHQRKTSPEARGYYFGVVVVFWMRAYHESDPYEMHETLKLLFNSKPVVFAGEVHRRPMSTASDKMEHLDFSDFVERCRAGFAEEYGHEIPDSKSPVSLEMIEEYNALGNAREPLQ